MLKALAFFLDEATTELLLGAGANANARASNDWTALMLAAAKGHVGVARRLLEAGADANRTDIYGGTPLMRAAREGRTEIVRLLVGRRDVAINAQDDQGETALHYAAAAGEIESARLLLAHRADPSRRDAYGRTPAMLAAASGHAELASTLRRAPRFQRGS